MTHRNARRRHRCLCEAVSSIIASGKAEARSMEGEAAKRQGPADWESVEVVWEWPEWEGGRQEAVVEQAVANVGGGVE